MTPYSPCLSLVGHTLTGYVDRYRAGDASNPPAGDALSDRRLHWRAGRARAARPQLHAADVRREGVRDDRSHHYGAPHDERDVGTGDSGLASEPTDCHNLDTGAHVRRECTEAASHHAAVDGAGGSARECAAIGSVDRARAGTSDRDTPADTASDVATTSDATSDATGVSSETRITEDVGGVRGTSRAEAEASASSAPEEVTSRQVRYPIS